MGSYKSNQNNKALAILAIIALLGVSGYQWFSNNQLKSKFKQQEAALIEIETIQAELNHDYSIALENLEDLKSENEDLNKLIDSQKKELAEQREKVNELIFVKRDLGRARDELSKLNSQVVQYVNEINKMKEEIGVLTEDNIQLRQQTVMLTSDLEQEREIKSKLEQENIDLSTEKEELTKTKETLGKKVDIANAIKINKMEVTGFSESKNGKLKSTNKSKNIDLLRVCFVTEQNLVTPSGSKTFYARVISPTGETIAVEDAGSGVLTDKMTNEKVRYTTSGSVNYNNQETNACLDWKLQNALFKGLYELEIYNNGYLVGKGDFLLK
jgi:myosin heavy subunit